MKTLRYRSFSSAALLSIGLALVLALPSISSAQLSDDSVSFTTPGSYTWQIPSNVSQIGVETWGAGGAGGLGYKGGNHNYSGYGGGGGGYSEKAISVNGGETLTITVGAGGTDGSNAQGGGASEIYINGSLIAGAGGGGGGASILGGGSPGPSGSTGGGTGGGTAGCNGQGCSGSAGGAGGAGYNGDTNQTGGSAGGYQTDNSSNPRASAGGNGANGGAGGAAGWEGRNGQCNTSCGSGGALAQDGTVQGGGGGGSDTGNGGNGANGEVIVSIMATFTKPPTTPADQAPIGYLDGADCSTFSGWSLDQDTPDQSTQVDFYADGPAGSGTGVGSTVANVSRPDVDQAEGVSGNHGFSFPTPASLMDGNPHQIYAYGIDTQANGTNTLLTNSPKTITCQPQQTQGYIQIKRVGDDDTVNSAPATSASVSGATQPDGSNPAYTGALASGSYTANATNVSGYTVTAGTCTYASGGSCSVPDSGFTISPSCDSDCSTSVAVTSGMTTKVVFKYEQIATPPPTAQGYIQIKRVGDDDTTNTAPTTSAQVVGSTQPDANNPAMSNALDAGAYTVSSTDASGYTAMVGTCTYATGNTACTVPDSAITQTPSCNGNQCSISSVSVSGNMTTKVVFKYVAQGTPSQTHNLTVSMTSGGSVSSSPVGINTCTSSCTAAFAQDQSVTLTATPSSGYAFSGWDSGPCTGTSTCALTISADTSVHASFEVTGTPCTGSCGGTGGPTPPVTPVQAPSTPILGGNASTTEYANTPYTVISTDPVGDSLQYDLVFVHGLQACADVAPDLIVPTTGGYAASGSLQTFQQAWTSNGPQTICAQAINMHGGRSAWGSLQVGVSVVTNYHEF